MQRAFKFLLVASGLCISLESARADDLLDALAYVEVVCQDPATGVQTEQKGSGFSITKSGDLVTAYHVVSCFDAKSKTRFDLSSLTVRFRSPNDPRLWKARVFDQNRKADVAILKIYGEGSSFAKLDACSLVAPTSGAKMIAHGYPQGQGHQPVPVVFGNAEGGEWFATAPFTGGMSGGPVFLGNQVVGIVKGGAAEVEAIRTISPLFRVKSMLSDAGFELPTCQPENPSTVTPGGGTSSATCVGPEASVAGQKKCLKIKESFKDCASCPEMVVVRPGSIVMRSEGSSGEVKVELPRAFAIGKYEVTFAEWDACIDGGGCTQVPSDQSFGRGRHPVINVSWRDVQNQYLPWLNRKLGLTSQNGYRLPTEPEWEYGARAGSTNLYTFGQINPSKANYDHNKNQTMPVDAPGFPENAWGLHHVQGNVWEWVQGCNTGNYVKDLKVEPGSDPAELDCGSRFAARGGSWKDRPEDLQLSHRGVSEDVRHFGIGFRVARDLAP